MEDSIVVGNYVIFRRAIAYADVAYQWEQEQRHYKNVNGFSVFDDVSYSTATGIRMCFINAPQLIFPDALPETAALRAWLTGATPGRAGLSPQQNEVVTGLPSDLAALFSQGGS